MFKKAIIYQITQPLPNDYQERLEKAVSKRPEGVCGDQESVRRGFAPPCGQGEILTKAGDTVFLCLRVSEKKVQAAAVRSEQMRRIADREAQTGEKVKAKEKTEIKEQIILEALPKTIPCDSYIHGFINLKNGRVAIAGSSKEAETFASELREALGSFPVVPLSPQMAMPFISEQVIREDLEIAGVEVGSDCTLKEEEENETAQFKNANLHSDEVKSHLDAGLSPTKVEFVFRDAFSAVIGEDMKITTIKAFEQTTQDFSYEEAEDSYTRQRIELEIFELCVNTIVDLLDPALNFEPRPLS